MAQAQVVPRVFGGTIILNVASPPATTTVTAIGRDGRTAAIGRDGKVAASGRDGQVIGKGR